MAEGGRIGVAYVELDLDPSRYLKGQQQLLKDATTISLSIEKNFQNLGIKSSAVFDLTRAKITNSYDMIANSSKATANDIVRAEEAKNAKLKQLNEQQFGAHTSLLDSLKKNWMAVAAIATTVYMAVIKPIEAYMESEKALLKMGMAMKNQGDYTRAGLADMEAFSKEIQRITAFEDDATLAIMANMKSYGMSNEQVKLATRAALDLAMAKENEGMTIERASEILGKSYLGITTGLKKLGIQVDENIHGAAIFDSVMNQLNQRFGGSAQAELLTYSGQWKQLKNNWGDIQEFLGLVFLKTIEGLKTAFLGVATGFWAVVTGVTQGLAWIAQGLEAFQRAIGMEKAADATKVFSDALQWAADSAKAATQEAGRMTAGNAKAAVSFDSVSGAIDKMGIAGKRTQAIDEEGTKAKEAAIKRILEAIRKAGIEIDAEGKSVYEKELIRIASEVKEYKKLGVDKINIDKFVKSETLIVETKRAEEFRKLQQNSAEVYLLFQEKQLEEHDTAIREKYFEEKKYAEDLKKLGEKSTEDYLLAQEKQREEHDTIIREMYFAEKEAAKKTAEDVVKLAADRLRAYHDLYKDLKGYEGDYYKSSKTIILKQEEDYRNLLIDKNTSAEDAARIELAIAARTLEEHRKNNEKRILQSNDFFAGMKVQIDQNLRDQAAWGQVGADVFKRFTTDAQRQLSDNLFNFLTLRFDKLKLDWNSLWEGMLKVLTDKIAQMAIESAVSDIFKPLSISAWKWVGSIFAEKGIWEVEGAAKGIPVIAHAGEMIIPADIAKKLRGLIEELLTTKTGYPSLPEIARIEAIAAEAGYPGYAEAAYRTEAIAAEAGYPGYAEAAARAGISSLIMGLFSTALGYIIPPELKTGSGIGGLAGMGIGLLAGSAAFGPIGMIAGAIVQGLFGDKGGMTRAQKANWKAQENWLGIVTAERLLNLIFQYGSFKQIPFGEIPLEAGYRPSIYGKVAELRTSIGLGPEYGRLSDIIQYAIPQEVVSFLGPYLNQYQAILAGAFPNFSPSFPSGPSIMRGGANVMEGFRPDLNSYMVQMSSGGEFSFGGLARHRSIFGERGPEWAVPTYEPERSRFLRDVGVDLPAIADALAKRLTGNNGGITINFNIDGNLIADQRVFDEFVEKIDYALDKRSRRVYAS